MLQRRADKAHLLPSAFIDGRDDACLSLRQAVPSVLHLRCEACLMGGTLKVGKAAM